MASAEFAALSSKDPHTASASATPAASIQPDIGVQLEPATVASAGDDDDDGASAPGGHPKHHGPGPMAAAPLGYQRVLFEQLQQALRGSDSATATAAAAALPWLLQRFCVALRHQQMLAAAGLYFALQANQSCRSSLVDLFVHNDTRYQWRKVVAVMHPVALSGVTHRLEPKTLQGASGGLSVQMRLRWRMGMHHAAQGPAAGRRQMGAEQKTSGGLPRAADFHFFVALLHPSCMTSSKPLPPATTARTQCSAASERRRESSTHRIMTGKAMPQLRLGSEASGESPAPLLCVPCLL